MNKAVGRWVFLSKNSVLVGLYVPNAEDEQIGK